MSFTALICHCYLIQLGGEKEIYAFLTTAKHLSYLDFANSYLRLINHGFKLTEKVPFQMKRPEPKGAKYFTRKLRFAVVVPPFVHHVLFNFVLLTFLQFGLFDSLLCLAPTCFVRWNHFSQVRRREGACHSLCLFFAWNSVWGHTVQDGGENKCLPTPLCTHPIIILAHNQALFSSGNR